jgi:hypothetical protein
LSDRKLAIAIAIALFVFFGTLLYRAYFMKPDVVPRSVDVKETADNPKPSIRTKMITCNRVRSITRLLGFVENTGSVPLSAVTLQTIWKDEYNTILDTGLVYVVGNEEPLYPGEKREFEDTTGLRGVARCNVRALDWWSSES